MRPELEHIEIPGESEAQERAWAMLVREFEDRVPTPQRSHWPRVAAVAIALAALLASAFSSPGRAVIDEIREVVGVERAERTLFSLPSEGRLLVASDTGVWVVQPDGSKRLLEGYREASWSPFGRFVVATRPDELAALERDGDVRWTLPRPRVRSARWTGSEVDTRIAYVTGRQPRVVAGDGTEDEPLCAVSTHRQVAPAWSPRAGFTIAVAAPSGAVSVTDLDGCVQRWVSAPTVGPRRLEWSSDGQRILVETLEDVRVLRAGTGAIASVEQTSEAAFRPESHQLASIRKRGEMSQVVVGDRIVFRGAGELRDLTWSPDGRWLLVAWPTADQWLFVRADGRGIRAVSNISEQFRSRAFPRVDGWCCTR